MDWNQYLDQSKESDMPLEKNEGVSQDKGVTLLDRKDIGLFTSRLSGKDAGGESKVIVSYQTYAMEDPEESVDKQRVYTSNKPHVEISFDSHFPQFYLIDIVFKSCDDPELKMLWGRMQRFKRNMAGSPEKTWIFYFNILEKESITVQTLERDNPLVANILNPVMFFLTREVPDMLAADMQDMDGTLNGGNIIRMLVPTEFVTFQITDDIDTSQIKGEVMRENESNRFLNQLQDGSYTE